MTRKPNFRKLRCYALDPFLSLRLDTFDIHELEYIIKWEDLEDDQPIGDYLEIIDYDPTTRKFYTPVNLNEARILVEDGLNPSESNPQFHQQMVYAICMKTIHNFEKALGRKVNWSKRQVLINGVEKEIFVKKLRIYPHALREANAYYSPRKKAILFGYFKAASDNPQLIMPQSIVFTCLSHDIIAHELTHALIDGLFRLYNVPTNPDVLAFHEGFSDIIALFQHFTFPQLLKHQIAKTRGHLEDQNMLGQLAIQFGSALGKRGALRSAIGKLENEKWVPIEANIEDYKNAKTPHERGGILVAAIFDAFLLIYKRRIADLVRLSSGGSGILPLGEIHPDLVNRLAKEASKASQHILNMCIRALDYCPAIDITFGDFLRAIITSDLDLVKNDSLEYRVAFIEAFKKRGIFPRDLQILSVESLRWKNLDIKLLDADLDGDNATVTSPYNYKSYTNEVLKSLLNIFKKYGERIHYVEDRELRDKITQEFLNEKFNGENGFNEVLVKQLSEKDSDLVDDLLEITGLYFTNDQESMHQIGLDKNSKYDIPYIKIEDFHLVNRVGPDGDLLNLVFLTLSERVGVKFEVNEDSIEITGSYVPKNDADNEQGMIFYGLCTLVFDLDDKALKYAIKKPIFELTMQKKKNVVNLNKSRIKEELAYMFGHVGEPQNDFELYFGQSTRNRFSEPFSLLHNH